MKKKLQRIYMACLGLLPACAAFMLTAIANSSSCWLCGQDEVPDGLKKYRKF